MLFIEYLSALKHNYIETINYYLYNMFSEKNYRLKNINKFSKERGINAMV